MKKIIIILLLINATSSCDDLFQYSPYDADVSEYNVNEKNIRKIVPVSADDTLWFVTFSDTHHWYDALYDATQKINSLKNISFVVVCGDVTDAGLAKEFEWYNQVMKNLNVPYITIIGNHDYRSNGSVVYKKMFGPSNFTFDISPYHFICFDDVVWENDNTLPDFEWLNSNLLTTTTPIQVVLAHLPPWSKDLDLSVTELEQIITNKPDHILIVHGHEHKYYHELFPVEHVVMGCLDDRNIYLIGLCDTSYTMKRLNF